MITFKKRSRLGNAAVYIDYEHWFYSYNNLYGLTPDLKSYFEDLKKEYKLIHITVFADFSHALISPEYVKLQSIMNCKIVNTQYLGNNKKNMTDFIMLDYIYQSIIDKLKAETYIIFTGDSHFQSVVKYLVQKQKKRVIIYGVKNALSQYLKSAATAVKELPSPADAANARSAEFF